MIGKDHNPFMLLAQRCVGRHVAGGEADREEWQSPLTKEKGRRSNPRIRAG